MEERRSLREATEAGKASVLIVGYFHRLMRSLRVQGEVVSRVEAAGDAGRGTTPGRKRAAAFTHREVGERREPHESGDVG